MKKHEIGITESKKWLSDKIKPYRGRIAILTVTSVLASLFSVAFAYVTQFLVNGASAGEKTLIIILACALVAILLLRIVARTLNSYLSEKYRVKMAVELSDNAFLKTLSSSVDKVSSYHSGELSNRIIADSREVAADTMAIVPVTAGLVAQFAGCLIALMTTDVAFTLILIVGGALIFGLSVIFKAKLKAYQKQIMALDGEGRSFTQESIASINTIKSYGAEGRVSEKSRKIFSAYSGKRIARAKTYSAVNVLYSLVSNMGLVFAVIWCTLGVVKGRMEYGAILSVVLLMEQLQRPLTSFASVMPVVYARSASAERLYEIETFPVENVTDSAVTCDNFDKIVIDDLTFGYGDAKILNGVTGEIKKGELTCITGRSGVGKSTLLKLMLALYKPLSGTMEIVDFRGKHEIEVGDRKLFGYVPQGNYLFSGTIRENLALFAPDIVDDDDYKEALNIACAEFVFDLKDGLNTPLGERGAGLSEGQVQRIAVARAVLSKRPVLLLDEATSALDEKTEYRLIKNLKELSGRTIVFISHRPAAVALSDSEIRL